MTHSTRKEIGYESEKLVGKHYIDKGYIIKEYNYTIKGGEIDIIVENDDEILFIEVKNTSAMQEIHGYISPHKMKNLEYTIAHYLHKHPTHKLYKINVVFVENNSIKHIFKEME